MQPLVYRVTKTTIPRWLPIHPEQPRGIAYETDTHFVHLYGRDSGLWVISPGLTATEAKSGTLRDWIDRVFGAVEVEQASTPVGHCVHGVWRPGLLHENETLQGLAVTDFERRLAEQALFLLIDRLDELLHFVEPTERTLETHSHKARELLILACTEVESAWKAYLRIAGMEKPARGDFNTNHYVKVHGKLHLAEFEVSLPRYADVAPMRPFVGWSASAPSTSLPWYDSYNKTKHDRSTHFAEATVRNCLQAVAANIVLFSVRFGPMRLMMGNDKLSANFNQLFQIALRDSSPTSFYVPLIKLPASYSPHLVCGGADKFIEPRIVAPLKL